MRAFLFFFQLREDALTLEFSFLSFSFPALAPVGTVAVTRQQKKEPLFLSCFVKLFTVFRTFFFSFLLFSWKLHHLHIFLKLFFFFFVLSCITFNQSSCCMLLFFFLFLLSLTEKKGKKKSK